MSDVDKLDDRLYQMDSRVDKIQETLATEMLKEIKATSRRWFIAFIVVLVLWFGTIGVFIWYLTLPVEETTYTQTVDDIDQSDIVQNIGGDYDGESNTDSEKEEESSTQ